MRYGVFRCCEGWVERGRASRVQLLGRAQLQNPCLRSGSSGTDGQRTDALDGKADDIGADNALIHLDTYHINVEENDFVRPVLAMGEPAG